MTALRRLRSRVAANLGVARWAAAAGVLFAAAVVAFAGLTEDVTGHNGQQRLDARRLHWFATHRTTDLVHAARLVTDLGAATVLVPVAIVVAAVLWRRRHPVALAAAPLAALLGAGAVTAILKPSVGRIRPPLGTRLVAESEPSFPSGHAADSTAFYLALGLVLAVFVFRKPIARLLVSAVSAAIPALVGFSRLVLGVHWPTDVFAGWALGIAVAVAAVALAGSARRWGDDCAPSHRIVALLVRRRGMGAPRAQLVAT